LPAGSGDSFVDDDESVFESDIERLAASGVTRGCNPPTNDRFCPDDPVTRGAMAAFLVRAFGYSDGVGSDAFSDDDSSVFESDIERLAAAGVTVGCNPPDNTLFCPDDPVTRAQMATFLGRALGLTPDTPPPTTSTSIGGSTSTTSDDSTTTTDDDGSTTSTTSGGGGATVDIDARDFVFDPADVIIDAGDTVRVTNSQGSHNIIWVDMEDPGQPTGTGWVESRVFDDSDAGESFDFYCSLHGTAGGAGMAGSVTVNP